MTIREHEAAWREALAAVERNDSLVNVAREQEAYDAYAEACDAAGVCLALGCDAPADRAHCVHHGG